jgi:hypothetical protein
MACFFIVCSFATNIIGTLKNTKKLKIFILAVHNLFHNLSPHALSLAQPIIFQPDARFARTKRNDRILALPLVLLLTVSCGTVCAQTDDVFVGGLSVKGSRDYVYKVRFTDSSGYLKGYSVTDVLGANETKTALVGRIDESRKTVTLNETQILYTKSAADSTDFCFVHAKLKIAKKQDLITLKGRFTGYKPDGKTVCAKGTIALVSSRQLLDNLLEIAASTDTAPRPQTDTAALIKMINAHAARGDAPVPVFKVDPDSTLIFQAGAHDVTFEIWDNKMIDNDVVTVWYNQDTLLSNYTLHGNHKMLSLSHTGKRDVLRMIAVSEGTEPTCTARIRITAGGNVYDVDATATLHHDVRIVLQ